MQIRLQDVLEDEKLLRWRRGEDQQMFTGFKGKEYMLFVEQNYKLSQKRDWIENEKSHTALERWTLWFSSYKNCVLKVRLWWVGFPERKRVYFL